MQRNFRTKPRLCRFPRDVQILLDRARGQGGRAVAWAGCIVSKEVVNRPRYVSRFSRTQCLETCCAGSRTRFEYGLVSNATSCAIGASGRCLEQGPHSTTVRFSSARVGRQCSVLMKLSWPVLKKSVLQTVFPDGCSSMWQQMQIEISVIDCKLIGWI